MSGGEFLSKDIDDDPTIQTPKENQKFFNKTKGGKIASKLFYAMDKSNKRNETKKKAIKRTTAKKKHEKMSGDNAKKWVKKNTTKAKKGYK